MDYLKMINDIIPLTGFRYEKTRQDDDSNKLIKKLKENSFTSENDLIKSIYGKATGVRDKYRFLANRAISILTGRLMLENTERKTDWKSVYLDCTKKVAVVKTLKAKDAQEAALGIAISALEKAIRFGVTDASVALSKELMLSYQIKGDSDQASYYKNLWRQYIKIEKSETDAYSALNEINTITSKSAKPNETQSYEILRLLDFAINTEADSYLLNIIKLKARVARANFTNDHPEFAKVYWDFNDYQKSLKFEPPTGHIFNILNKISPSLIITENFELAESNINRCLGIPAGEHNHNITLRHKAVLGFNTNNLSIIDEAIQQAEVNTRGLRDNYKEWWKIAKAYRQFLGLFNNPGYQTDFKTSKFVNNFTVLMRDKTGANVSILTVGECLLRLIDNERDFLIERNEAIRLYTHRNLKKGTTKRASIFLKILRVISSPRCEFDPVKFKSLTTKLVEELKSTPMKIEDLFVEIIRYETLYEMIIEILERQKTGVKRGEFVRMK